MLFSHFWLQCKLRVRDAITIKCVCLHFFYSSIWPFLYLQLYCQIVDAQMDYPANWDKNLALAAERLLRLGGGRHDLESLLNHSIQHFSRYIEREPTDPQSDAIRSAITHLSKERDILRDSHRKTDHRPLWNLRKTSENVNPLYHI